MQLLKKGIVCQMKKAQSSSGVEEVQKPPVIPDQMRRWHLNNLFIITARRYLFGSFADDGICKLFQIPVRQSQCSFRQKAAQDPISPPLNFTGLRTGFLIAEIQQTYQQRSFGLQQQHLSSGEQRNNSAGSAVPVALVTSWCASSRCWYNAGAVDTTSTVMI